MPMMKKLGPYTLSTTLMFHHRCVKEESRSTNPGEELFTISGRFALSGETWWFLHGFIFTQQKHQSFYGLTEQAGFVFIFIHCWFHFIMQSDLKGSELKSPSHFSYKLGKLSSETPCASVLKLNYTL